MTNCDYENKVSDDEIISSLEVIAITRNCNECKIRNCRWGDCNCSQITATAALDLINRQKTEIEQWKEEANKYQNLWCIAIDDIETVKSKAVQEFAEKSKNILRNIPKWNVKKVNFNNVGFSYDDVFFSTENILKEMLGEE